MEYNSTLGRRTEARSLQERLRKTLFYRDLHRFISRYWKPHITAAGFSVLDMIFDRTIGWGKIWERISLSQFVKGVWVVDESGRVYSDGTGLGKRTIQRTIETLVRERVLNERAIHGQASQYAINFSWHPPQRQYRIGNEVFAPEGWASYWDSVAAESKATFAEIQRIQRDEQSIVINSSESLTGLLPILAHAESPVGYPSSRTDLYYEDE